MSISVVSNSGFMNDDKVSVPSIDDFSKLEANIASLRQAISKRILADIVNEKEDNIYKSIDQLNSSFKSLKDEILRLISSEAFKQELTNEISLQYEKLENRYHEIDLALNKKLNQVTAKSQIETAIEEILIDNECKMVNIIQKYGEKLIKDIKCYKEKQINFVLTQKDKELEKSFIDKFDIINIQIEELRKDKNKLQNYFDLSVELNNSNKAMMKSLKIFKSFIIALFLLSLSIFIIILIKVST